MHVACRTITKQRLTKVKSMNIIYQHKQTPHLCVCVWYYAVIIIARHFHLHSYCLPAFFLLFLRWASLLSKVYNRVLDRLEAWIKLWQEHVREGERRNFVVFKSPDALMFLHVVDFSFLQCFSFVKTQTQIKACSLSVLAFFAFIYYTQGLRFFFSLSAPFLVDTTRALWFCCVVNLSHIHCKKNIKINLSSHPFKSFSLIL